MNKEIIHYFERKIVDYKEAMSTMVNEHNRANYQREIDKLDSYIQHLANGVQASEATAILPHVSGSAIPPLKELALSELDGIENQAKNLHSDSMHHLRCSIEGSAKRAAEFIRKHYR